MTTQDSRKTVTNRDGSRTRARQINKDRVASLLITNMSIKEIAKKVKVAPSTVYKLMDDPEIQAIVAEAHAITRVEAVRQIGDMITPALETIAKQIEDGDGKLALMFLKEINALRSAGNDSGFDSDTDLGKVQIVINTSGHTTIGTATNDDNSGENSHIPDTKPIIDAEIVE